MDAGADGFVVQGGSPIVLDFDGPTQVVTGTQVGVTVTVQREGQQGFTGLVHISLASIDGVMATPIDLPPDHASGTLTLVIAPDRINGNVPITITGTSPDTTSVGSVVYTPLIRGAAGAADTGFGTGGLFTYPDPSAATGLIISNDKIFMGGEIQGDLAVIGLSADGTLDSGFGTNGIARRAVDGLVSTNDMDLLKSGVLYLGANTTSSAIVGAFTQTGGAPNFGTEGVASVPLAVGSTLAASPAVALPTTFLVGGQPTAGSADSAVVLFNEDGTENNVWPGGMGLQYSNSCSGASDTSDCVPRGLSSNSVTADVFLCAWEHSGSALVGRQFAGSALPTVESGTYLDRCTSTAAQSGQVYMAGDANGLATVIRVVGSSIDMTFNPGGARPAAATAPTGSGLTLAKKIIAQEDGTFILATDATVNSHGAFGVWRLTSAGKSDLNFGNPNGYSTLAVPGTDVTVTSMGVDSENRIVVAGSNGHMVVARFWQ